MEHHQAYKYVSVGVPEREEREKGAKSYLKEIVDKFPQIFGEI